MSLPTVVLSLIVLALFDASSPSPINEFESLRGCHQFNSHSGYYAVHPYFNTSTFKNIQTDGNGVTRLRIGVLGDKHAAIRFTSVPTGYTASMTEIALAYYDNNRTDIRKYSRSLLSPGAAWTNLGEFHVKNVMNIYKPVMLTVAIRPNGLVTVTRDGENVPFLLFNDPSFSFKFIGFCKWDVPVVFFYDCPLLVERKCACDD
ncbi:hypothetical protein quinque_015365 [Culex quinquefasciatus]